MEEIRIQMSSKGPYMIKGYMVIVVDSEGNEIEKEGTVALCRCGLSNKKPFCDGAHRNCETLWVESLATDALFPLADRVGGTTYQSQSSLGE